MRVEIAVQVEPLHSQLVLLVSQHLLGRNDPGANDALAMIEVSKKQVQGLDPLNTATFHHPPFTGGNTARDGVEGNQALSALFVAIEGEGNTGAMEQQVGFTPTLCQQFRRGVGQPAGELPVMRTDLAVCAVHLIKKGADHAELLVTRAPKPSQAPCQRHNSFDFNRLYFQRRAVAPDACNRYDYAVINASLRGVVQASGRSCLTPQPSISPPSGAITASKSCSNSPIPP
ncbi:hypothetical protein D3C81_1578650 [compost metagenome]